MVADVRPISRTSPSTCRKIKYSNRSDTPGSCPTSDHRWSATQARLLAPHRVGETLSSIELPHFDIGRRAVEILLDDRTASGTHTVPMPLNARTRSQLHPPTPPARRGVRTVTGRQRAERTVRCGWS